ncbi:sperm-associated antigen 1 isoform X2 [Corvus cornix cornix]|uniref:sperm-associated antigen 1 isoform X2 n=1 Tax=Corvus cornix cornix TaxID=932674 RepID=UPI0005357AD2|nr:sperm-associated antigen 1 isoform X2 [Corvus cornix cornix]
MGDESVPFLLGEGTTKTYQIPISHLDYKFIEKCTDVKHLEKILRVLRSGEEGCYPELTLVCEKRIEHLDPRSRVLRKDKPAATASDFTAEEWEAINSELMSWLTEMNEDDKKSQLLRTDRPNERQDNLPPIRCSSSCLPTNQKSLLEIEKKLRGLEPVSEPQGKGKRILIQELDDSENGEEGRENTEECERRGGDKTSAAAARAAAGEPAMGNAHRKSHGKGGSKAQDRETHRQKDSDEGRSKKGASEKKSGKHLSDREGEVNGYLRSDEKSESPEAEEISKPHREGSQSAGGGSSTSLPLTAAKLKSEGNELFKSGQFGEAVLKYSEAIEYVVGLGEQSPDDLSILYSNRAACYLKEGNCSDCIQDCNRALELQPFSLKPLLRRAMANESMERYRQAYIDYKTVLQIDSSIQAANDSANRITKTLIDQDGPSWREKLPPIPVVPVAAQLHRWDGGSLTSENKPSTIDINREEQLQMNREEAMEKFNKLKNEGNDFVKTGEYEEAANKYSECMKLNTEECTVYTNRALCYLKLYKYEEAKQDCDHVLQIEDSNIKAFYRRALAYKGLQNYEASVDDFNKVLLIDPSVVEAQKELEDVTRLLDLDSSAGAGSRQKQGKKITIQEVTEPDEQEERQFATSEDAETHHVPAEEAVPKLVPQKSSEKLCVSEPSNAYEFGQIINAVNANKDKAACADLLTITDPKKLPVLLSNKLEGKILLIFIQSLEHYVAGKDPGLAYQHLFYLSKAERFKVVLALLSKSEKEEVQQLFDLLSESQSDQYSLEDLERLKKVYEL